MIYHKRNHQATKKHFYIPSSDKQFLVCVQKVSKK